MPRVPLRSDLHLGVNYGDRTAFGSPVSDRLEPAIRRLYAPLVTYAQQHGFAELVVAASALLRDVVQSDAFARVAVAGGGGGWQLRPDVLFPDAARARPEQFLVVREATSRHVTVTLPPEYWPRIHRLVAALERGDCDPDDSSLHPDL